MDDLKKLLLLMLLPVKLFSLNDAIDNTTLYNRALGGPHSAMAKGFDSFFNNPALLVEYEEEFSLFSLDLNLKGDALDLINLYMGGELSLDDTGDMIDTLQSRGLTSLLIGLDLPGPISVGRIGNNWGWYIHNSTNIYINMPGLTSDATIIAREDLTFSIGIAFPFRFFFENGIFIELSPGVMSRTTIRGEVEIESDLAGFMVYMEDFTTLLTDYPLNLSPMFALDLGGSINVNDIVRISGVVKDIYTPILKYPVSELSEAFTIFSSSDVTSGTLVYREVNIGLGVDVPLGPLSLVASDLNVYIDYFDLLDFNKNAWLHIGAGLDLELLKKFHLLAGINEGLLSLGVNVDVGNFDIGFALYGTEESSQPGVQSTFNFLISMGISI